MNASENNPEESEHSTTVSSRWSTGPVRLVVAPMETTEQKHTTWAAATLARWFDAPLQVMTHDESEMEGLERTSGRLGVHERPVICIEPDRAPETIGDQVANESPAVIVLPTTPDALALAVQLPQPSYMVPETNSHRLPTGPLVVAMHFDESDIDVLAVAAVWAHHLECQIRLVVDGSASDDDFHLVADAVARLESMGLGATVDEVRNLGRDLLTIAETRRATALLIPASRPDDLRNAAMWPGSKVSILACPTAKDAMLADRVIANATSDPPAQTVVETIERDECLKLLGQHRVGRLGYIDDGWPTVIPINYRAEAEDIFIRSLPGHKLESAQERLVACIEVDHVDEWARTGWSVVVHGPLEVITDPDVLKTAWANDPDPWITSARWHWLRLEPLSITGRRVVARS